MLEKLCAFAGIALMLYGIVLAVSLPRPMKDRRHRALFRGFCALLFFSLIVYAEYARYLYAGESFLAPKPLTGLMFFSGAVFAVLAATMFPLVYAGRSAAMAGVKGSEKFFQSANTQMENLLNAVKNGEKFRLRFENPGLVKCWEVKKCGHQACPAYKSEDLRCWQVAGTYCGGQIQGAFAQKIGRCENCEVYKKATENVLPRMGEIFNNAALLLEQKVREAEKSAAELKKTQESLVRAEKMSAVGQLAAGVAHEINNPLGIILGFAQSAIKGIKEGEPLTLPLKTIERETRRCRDLVHNLLVFSRTSQDARLEDMDLNAAVESALSLISAQARTRKVELSAELGADLPKVRANKNQIQQIIINLANNAIDAMPDGGTLAITTSLSGKRPGHVKIRVRDTGTGIPKELHKKIFDPFFTTKEVGKGTGLGLSLAYEIAHKHGGAVELESEEGKGTEFTVFLPVRPAAAQTAI